MQDKYTLILNLLLYQVKQLINLFLTIGVTLLQTKHVHYYIFKHVHILHFSNIICCWFEGLHRSHRRGNRHSHPQQNTIASQFFSPFSFGLGMNGMDDFFNSGANGFTSFSSFNSTFSGSGNGAVKRTSTSTRFINGKKITTKK